MAVRLRLARAGAKRRPVYRIVATDARSPRDGRFIEQLGMYDPTRQPEVLSFKEDRLQHWLSVGAQPSATLKTLLARHRRRVAEAEAATP